MDTHVYLWTDGSWCYRDDLTKFVAMKGENYEALTEEEFYKLYPEVI